MNLPTLAAVFDMPRVVLKRHTFLVPLSITTVVTLLLHTGNSQTLDIFNPSPNRRVRTIATLPEGRILIGGDFSTVSGQPRSFVARLNSDGSLDPSFTQEVSTVPGSGTATNINCIAVQADGKIILGGIFTSPSAYLCRLNADGTVDTNFTSYADNPVSCLAVQADGKILVGGSFTSLSGQPRGRLGRFNSDGTLDMSFNPNASNIVNCLALQPDGKILVGGSFAGIGGQLRSRIARLNSNGSLDTMNPGANGAVVCISIQSDGGIVVGGSFTTLGGQARNRIGRLKTDGSVDLAFNPGASSAVNSIIIQADGSFVVGGTFTNLGGLPRNYFGRLSSGGMIDATFASNADAPVDAVALQADGNIVLSGQFNTLGGQPRNYLGKLNNTVAAMESFSFDGTTIEWLRSGSSPEVQWALFEVTTNGNDWVNLGPGIRTLGGWQISGLSMPLLATVRALGFLPSGANNGSSSVLESGAGAPVIINGPKGRTNNFGSTSWFIVDSAGTSPRSYRWLKNGGTLSNSGNVSGSQSSILVLSNVSGGDTGQYSLAISNSSGSVTSAVAVLKVLDPIITTQPVSQLAETGESRTLTVGVTGTSPSFQWFRNGVSLAGATAASLSLTNLQGTDAGMYHAVVSNQFGSITSAVVALTVNLTAVDSMNPGVVQPGNSFSVFSVVPQPDGGILLGGAFTQVAGQSRNKIARLNADGSLDQAFNPGASDWVGSFALDETLGIFAAGSFSTLSGQMRRGIGRINPNGTPDASFNPSGNYAPVTCIGMQADGRPIIGGYNSLARLNHDGSIDSSFNPAPSGFVYCVAIQPDERILVGGDFTMLGGQSCNKIGRLNTNGSLDVAFAPQVNGTVFAISVQADNKILLGGLLTDVAGHARTNIARLNPDGTLDFAFSGRTDTGISSYVNSLAAQTDGRVLVGGTFNELGGQSRNQIGRLNSDGSLDLTFNPNALGGEGVYSVVLQGNGNVLVGGSFGTLGGQNRTNVGRLKNTGLATESLALTDSAIIWLRDGTSPEVWRTSFDFTTNGIVWSRLGNGQRTSGGWQLTNVHLPLEATIRARGFVAGSYRSGSSWYVESLLSPQDRLRIVANDNSFGFHSNHFAFNISAKSNSAVVIEASTNLIQWNSINTNWVNDTGYFLFQDLDSLLYPRRFYRARHY